MTVVLDEVEEVYKKIPMSFNTYEISNIGNVQIKGCRQILKHSKNKKGQEMVGLTALLLQ